MKLKMKEQLFMDNKKNLELILDYINRIEKYI